VAYELAKGLSNSDVHILRGRNVADVAASHLAGPTPKPKASCLPAKLDGVSANPPSTLQHLRWGRYVRVRAFKRAPRVGKCEACADLACFQPLKRRRQVVANVIGRPESQNGHAGLVSVVVLITVLAVGFPPTLPVPTYRIPQDARRQRAVFFGTWGTFCRSHTSLPVSSIM
jgi:hypothetical protein